MARAQASLVAAVAIIAAAAATLLVGTAASGATSYTVGEPGGSWDLETNLTAWASTVDFHPGDQLLFKYNASAHDVVEVTHAGYSSCSAASAVAGGTHETGSDAVKLNNYAARRYFICSNREHCAAGMKLEVRVTPPECTNVDRDSNMCSTYGAVSVVGAAPPGSSAGAAGSLLVTVVVSLLLLLLGLTLTTTA